LRQEVQKMLDKRYSPDQVSGRLKLKHPDYPSMQISHETIYQSLYVYSRGELKRELKAQLRRGQTTRKRRGRKENRGRIPNAVSIHDRPKEVEGRLVPRSPRRRPDQGLDRIELGRRHHRRTHHRLPDPAASAARLRRQPRRGRDHHRAVRAA